MRNIFLVCFLLLLSVQGILAQESKHNYKPSTGYVPDEKTALTIAEAVWLPIYGESIYSKKPFKAHLDGDTWIVAGSLPKGFRGGVPEAEISRDNGCVLRVSHGK